jgi:hypothetical protein
MWSDHSVSQNDSSLIACKNFPVNHSKYIFLFLANTLKTLTFSVDSERNFNERLLVSLGFVKVRIKIL